MPIILNNSNIEIQYNTGSSYVIETVKSDVFVREARTGISSNLFAEPLSISYERMYPPVRNFTAATTTISGQTYGNGTYVVSYSSTLGSSYPWTCFNTADGTGGHWANSRYTAGVFNSTSFIVSGYLGDWLKIQLPVAIKLTRFEFLMRTDTQGIKERSPKNFKIYGSNDNITWVELVNKTDAVYNASNKYEQTTPEITNTYTYYGLVVNKLLGSTADILNFDEWYIYGQETIVAIPEGTLHKRLNFIATNSYTLTFPFRTSVDVNNNSNLILQGDYNISVGVTTSSVLPAITNTSNRLIPLPNTSTSTVSLRYHLLNPVKTTQGAQWTYSSNNPNVYHLGYVGIGTTSPEYNLDVRGNIYTSIGGYTGSTLITWSITSDRRIKENIVKASYEKCLENVNKIELYNFNFKDNCVNTNDKHQLGFIAQEVREVYPKAVEVNKMILNTNETIDDILTLNTTQIDYTLYGAVKNLIEKIDNIDIELENLGSNITYNKDLIRNTSNIFSIITSNISITTSNIFTGTSNISITTSNISIITSNIFIGTSNIPIETSNIPTETSNIPIYTSYIPFDTSNISIN